MLIHLKKYDHPQVECFFITVIWFLAIDHFAELHLSVTFPGCRGGCRRCWRGQQCSPGLWGALTGTGIAWHCLQGFSPPFSASHGGRILLLALPIRSLCWQSDPWARFLKKALQQQGGNNNLEVLPKYLPRPAYDWYCCPGVGLELGGLDSVPLILMSWVQMQHLFWNELVVFLLLPSNYIM